MKKINSFYLEEKEITVKKYANDYDNWIEFKEIFDDIDLKLNFNTLVGSFINTKDKSEIATFKFKFKNKIFEVTQKENKKINHFLNNTGIDVPEYLFEHINQYFRNTNPKLTEKKQFNTSDKIYVLFTKVDVPVRYARQQLGHYLREKGMILRERINNPYFLDKKSNGYNSVEVDDIVKALDKKIFNNMDVVHTDDVKSALGFIGDRRKPQYNIVKFPNCLYDIENFKVITKTEKPIFTLTEVKYNYNPNAKGPKMSNFLKSSLKQNGDSEEELEKRVTGFLEMIGYILTSGNPLNAFFIIAGIRGAGKGVTTNIITAIFGFNKVGGIQLQELTPDNRFATAHLESKQVNIVRDSSKKPIEDTGMIKSITGYDDVPVEPKGKDKYMIPKEEVPDMIVVCNNFPKFKDGIDEAVVQRVVMFEFLNKFRGTDKQNKNLLKEILADEEEMEWLIYNGIKAYKDMIESEKDFEARIDEDKTKELLGKHTDPIRFVLSDLVKAEVDEDISLEDPIIASELNELIRFLVTKKGMSITDLDDYGRIKPHVLADKIRQCFDFDNWTTKSEYIKDLGKSVTVYPNIYKTAEYDTLLKEMEEVKKEKEETKKI